MQKTQTKEEGEKKEQTDKRGMRKCPQCGKLVVKFEASTLFHCQCGAYFCYYCGSGPYSYASICIDHIKSAHGKYFEDPPDYLEFILYKQQKAEAEKEKKERKEKNPQSTTTNNEAKDDTEDLHVDPLALEAFYRQYPNLRSIDSNHKQAS